MRPLLPLADRILPYLRRLEANRIYTNYGPLVREFEHRVAMHFALPDSGVASACSGTAALIGAILATAGRSTVERPLALMPAFTFVATASAAEQCGYQPYLTDIDAETWMLDPERLPRHPILAQVGVVIPVAPFGRPVPQQPWLEFRDRTGIPVVIDGAASFTVPSQNFVGALPVAVSFHATKGFGTGEGGAVVSTNTNLITQVMRSLNFGFLGSRDSRVASINGKMSEYHAAVGLAEFDGWEQKRCAFLDVASRYRQEMEAAGLLDRFFVTPEIGISYALFLCRTIAEAHRVQDKFGQAGVDLRFWYGSGLQNQTYFSAVAHDNLDTTAEVAPKLIGLPMAPDLTSAEITRVVLALTAATQT